MACTLPINTAALDIAISIFVCRITRGGADSQLNSIDVIIPNAAATSETVNWPSCIRPVSKFHKSKELAVTNRVVKTALHHPNSCLQRRPMPDDVLATQAISSIVSDLFSSPKLNIPRQFVIHDINAITGTIRRPPMYCTSLKGTPDRLCVSACLTAKKRITFTTAIPAYMNVEKTLSGSMLWLSEVLKPANSIKANNEQEIAKVPKISLASLKFVISSSSSALSNIWNCPQHG